MSELLRIGVVGTGMIGRTHIERINSRIQGGYVVGCADYNKKSAEKTAEQYHIRSYGDGMDLIHDSEIDAVIVTSSDASHEKYVLETIKAGKPVFCEKPLAPEPEACRRIVDAEIDTGKHLVQVGFMRRFDPGYGQLKKMIAGGKYGEPLVIHCCHRNYDDGGLGWQTRMSVENSMIHEIDVLRWLTGENFIKADVVLPKSSRNAGKDVKDPQILHLITESGIYIEIESFVFSHYGYDVRCEIVCEEGTLNLPEPPYAMVRSNDSRITPICHDWSERFPEAYDLEFQHWINAARKGMTDGPTAWDGYIAQITASCASRARDTGMAVDIKIPERPEFYD
jgi:myo-inositol 2-dehydrogenase/D-chiro-inositol 1-dehydrogenase